MPEFYLTTFVFFFEFFIFVLMFLCGACLWYVFVRCRIYITYEIHLCFLRFIIPKSITVENHPSVDLTIFILCISMTQVIYSYKNKNNTISTLKISREIKFVNVLDSWIYKRILYQFILFYCRMNIIFYLYLFFKFNICYCVVLVLWFEWASYNGVTWFFHGFEMSPFINYTIVVIIELMYIIFLQD